MNIPPTDWVSLFKYQMYSSFIYNFPISCLFPTLAQASTSSLSLLHPPHPVVHISESSTQLVHFPPVVVLKVAPDLRGFTLIIHTHTYIPTHAHVHMRTHACTYQRHQTHTGKSMQINPQAEPCYSINVSAPVISALLWSVSDDLEATSPFNWCHAPLLLDTD